MQAEAYAYAIVLLVLAVHEGSAPAATPAYSTPESVLKHHGVPWCSQLTTTGLYCDHCKGMPTPLLPLGVAVIQINNNYVLEI